MRSDSFIRCVRRVALLLLGVTAVLARTGLAQTTTGSVRGYVTDSSGAPLGEAAIVARLLATGREVTATTARSGAYALLGLAPGEYQVTVRLIGRGAQSQRLDLGVGQVLEVNFKLAEAAVQVAAVVISGNVVETRTSEVATNITPQQINNLPTPDRNFLGLAGLVPGARVEGGRIDDTRKTFSSGAQSANNVNVFIDGASYKNDLTGGGVAGQDASRGNPFPRNAVADFRVITQNFKAEYQKASSAIISASTQSGGNEWKGNTFFYYQGKELIALDSTQLSHLHDQGPNFKKPKYSRYQVGLSEGGPLVRDRLFIFAAYEGNYQDRENAVTFNNQDALIDTLAAHNPALDSVHLKTYKGNFPSAFRATLRFAKLSYEPTAAQTYELSYNLRHESDINDFG